MYAWQKMSVDEAEIFVSKRDPREYQWGFYSKPAFGDGQFSWFASVKELLFYVSHEMSRGDCAFLQDGSITIHKTKYLELKKAINKAIGESDILSANLMKKISKLLSSEILWWGTFTGLCSGRNEWSKHFIAAFLSDKNTKVLTTENIPEFINYINTWG